MRADDGWEITLGADAWAVLRAASAGLDLPTPFDLTPDLLGLSDDDTRAAAAALRASGLVTTDGRGGLVAGLQPAVLTALALLATAPVRLGLLVEHDGTRRDALWCLDGTVVAWLRTSTGGHVRLGAGRVDQVAEAVALDLGLPSTEHAGPSGTPLVLAEERLLAGAVHPEELLDDEAARALADLGDRPRARAVLTVASPAGASLVGLVRGRSGWWRMTPRRDDQVVLTPLGTDGPRRLVVDLLAPALAGRPVSP